MYWVNSPIAFEPQPTRSGKSIGSDGIAPVPPPIPVREVPQSVGFLPPLFMLSLHRQHDDPVVHDGG